MVRAVTRAVSNDVRKIVREELQSELEDLRNELKGMLAWSQARGGGTLAGAAAVAGRGAPWSSEPVGATSRSRSGHPPRRVARRPAAGRARRRFGTSDTARTEPSPPRRDARKPAARPTRQVVITQRGVGTGGPRTD